MNPQRTQPQPNSGPPRKGCLFWGCLVALILGVFAAGTAALLLFRVRNFVDRATAAEPAAIQVAEVPPEEATAVQTKVRNLVDAMAHQRAAEYSFSAREINAAIAALPEARALRGKARFAIDGNQVVAETSLPLDQIPGMAGRYLNGILTLDVQCENGVLEVYARDVTVKGEKVPSQILAALRQTNLAQKAYQNPQALAKLKQIEALTVRDGRVHVKTRGR